MGKTNDSWDAVQGYKVNGTALRQVSETLENKTLSTGCKYDTEDVTSTGTTLSVYKTSFIRNTTAGGTQMFNLGTLVAGARKRILCKVATSTAWVRVYTGSTAAPTFDGTNRYVKFTGPGFLDVEYLTSARYMITGKSTSAAVSAGATS